MAHGEKCPVCKGAGKIKTKKCHGCEGKGWVTIGVEYPPVTIPITPTERWPERYGTWAGKSVGAPCPDFKLDVQF